MRPYLHTTRPARSRHLGKRLCWTAVLSGSLLLPLHAATPRPKVPPELGKPAAPQGNAERGRGKSDDERCQECHGATGQGMAADNNFAKLAGQSPQYLLKQLRDFRSGERKHAVMSIVAAHLDDADAADIAAYFASQPRMQGTANTADAAAATLYTQEDAARGLPACATCHGDQGQGMAQGAEHAPRVGGQDSRYLARQLADWRNGERRNSPRGAMGQIARGLSDADIAALAAYLSGL